MKSLGFALLAICVLGVPARSQFHDDFTAKSPLPEWKWDDPGNDCKYQIGPLSGHLRMIVPPGNDHTTGHGAPMYSGPRLTVKAQGDFVITTHVTVNYSPTPAAKESGLMIWKDRNNNLQFKRTNAYNSQNVLLYGNIGNATTSFHGNTRTSANELFLRIVRSGSKFSAWFGTDGKTWASGGSVTWNVSGEMEVGLATSYWLWWGSGNTPANGDYAFFDLEYPTKSTMIADRAGISGTAGGTLGLALDTGAVWAGDIYLVLGSFSGATPGILLPGGKTLPLNIDPLFSLMLAVPGAPGLFPGTIGKLDSAGKASAQILLPAGLLTPLFGGALRFAAVLFPPTTIPMGVTNAAEVGIVK